MSLDNLDNDIERDPPDDHYCRLHEYIYAVRCPHCAVDEADRRHDERRERHE